jgi:hypothetical protein
MGSMARNDAASPSYARASRGVSYLLESPDFLPNVRCQVVAESRVGCLANRRMVGERRVPACFEHTKHQRGFIS